MCTTSERVKKAQDGVLEFLLINHPLDCPVCDKGGECPLQDQTLTYGPGESRFLEEKRHWEKPIALSSLVYLDRERCIQCDRCTRFADEVAGDPLIDFVGRGDHTEVNTFPESPFASYFSGNTVQICPVDLVVLDLMMPWSDGFDVLRGMGAARPKVVVLTSADDAYSERRARELGVDAYLVKPYDPEELAETVTRLLGGESASP